MTVLETQREMRIGLMGGFMGQLISGILWTISAAFATWAAPKSAIIFLIVSGFFIFPLTLLGLKFIRYPHKVPSSNSFNALGMQIAFIVPICLLLVGGTTLYKIEWFYPALMILLGAHYMPFITLYGMRMFGFLAGILIAAGVGLALYIPLPFYAGAWFTAGVLFVFAFLGRSQVKRELKV
jgi:hypothetical protein